MAINPLIPLQGKGVDLGAVIQRSLQTAAMLAHLRSTAQQRQKVDMQNRAQAMKGAHSITRDINALYDQTASAEIAPGAPGQEGMGAYSNPQARATAEANRAYQERLPQLMALLGVDADGLEKLGIPTVYDRERMKGLEQMFGQQVMTAQQAGIGGSGHVMQTPEGKLEKAPDYMAPGEEADKKQNQANTLRDDYRKDTENFSAVSESYNGIVNALQLNTGPGDLAAIIGFAKMLDPNSVVRESEIGMVVDAPGISESMKNKINSWLGGGKLTDESRMQFLEAAKSEYNSRMSGYERVLGKYEERASRANLNPDDVVMDYTAASAGVVDKMLAELKSGSGKGMTATPGNGKGVIPKNLQSIPDLRWNAARRQYRDPATGKTYDDQGNELRAGGPGSMPQMGIIGAR